MTSLADPTTLAELRAEFDGRVVGPGDDAYDEARSVFIGGVDRHPAAVVRPADAADVARIVSFARDSGLALAVRSGGHSPAGHGVVDDGIVIDLRDMRAVEIDVEAHTAWAQTGATAGEYTIAAAEHGLATGFGDSGSVGIGGITLGGGVGFLSRLHGLTVDSLLAAEIVTADGEILEIDAERHPDLFWAIRGGGGNFGVATRFKFRLHEVGTVVGGMLLLPATGETVSAFLAQAEAAPDELSGIVNVMPAPPMPFVPEERHGELVLMAQLCYAGPADDAERVLAPLRSLAEPIVDMVRPIPYPEIFPPEPDDYHPMAVFRSLFTREVDQALAGHVVARLGADAGAMRVTQFRVLGGAIERVPADATAYAHRSARIMANVVSFYEDPADRPAAESWADELAGDIRGDETAAYVNFLGDEGPERVRAAYPGATWDRLARIKATYDPANLFRSNQNIPPATGP
jgi:FAD binding domain/Berberine and berberine like